MKNRFHGLRFQAREKRQKFQIGKISEGSLDASLFHPNKNGYSRYQHFPFVGCNVYIFVILRGIKIPD
jgi:hypothetical protein